MQGFVRHRHHLAVLGGLFAISCTGSDARAAASNCYPAGMSGTVPPTSVVVLVDRTTPVDTAWADMRRHLLGTLMPAEYRILGFDGPQVQTLATVTLQPPPTTAQAAAMPIKQTRAVRACLERQAQDVAQRIGETLDKIEQGAASDAPFSEISYAVHDTLRQVVRPGQMVKLLVHSDGLEHARAGSSFYAQRLPRAVVTATELARLPAAVQLSPVAQALRGQISIAWYGLGAHDKRAAPYSAAAMASWQAFWTTLLVQHWGFTQVRIGATLHEPSGLR